MTSLLLAALLPLSASAAGTLIMVGGGEKPPAALDLLVERSGGKDARILVITWSTEDPQGAFEAVEPELSTRGAKVAHAARYDELPRRKDDFLRELADATGVFFSGGDQGRVMDVLKDADMLAALRRRHAEGLPFSGTSAGTAIMSRLMITGNGDWTTLDAAKVETREGLGLLDGVIMDQHFLKRGRMNRLMALVLSRRDLLGVGVDEDAALAVEGGRFARVLGPAQVVVIDGSARDGRLRVDVLAPGDAYDLKKRRRMR